MDSLAKNVAAKEYADRVILAIKTGDWEALLRLGTYDDFYGGWERVFRRIDRGTVPVIADDIKVAFQQIWLEHEHWPLEHEHWQLSIGKPTLLAHALRRLLPPYHGPAVTLFRGGTRLGWRGFSWTADINEAKRWVSGHDGVLVQASVQSEAIICKIEYPEPISGQEKAEILRDYPDYQFPDLSAEQEYVVDAARLTHWQFLSSDDGESGPRP